MMAGVGGSSRTLTDNLDYEWEIWDIQNWENVVQVLLDDFALPSKTWLFLLHSFNVLWFNKVSAKFGDTPTF
jgi:hypothetical protein